METEPFKTWVSLFLNPTDAGARADPEAETDRSMWADRIVVAGWTDLIAGTI